MNARASIHRVCAGCGAEASQIVAGRWLCDDSTCHQVTPGTRDKDQVSGEGGKGLYVVPGPGVIRSRPREPELAGLVGDYERGALQPVEVKLGELPAGASRAMHAVAADIRLLLGLRLAVDEDRPLPYSTRFCAERCGLRDHGQASRVLRALERVGVVKCAGKLEPRGKPDGTKLYQAPNEGGWRA